MSALAVRMRAVTEPLLPLATNHSLTVQPLTDEHTKEVLAFLAARLLHTVFIAGFIRDNGLVSPLNRGTFYGCRNMEGQLEGVALIGHANLFETRSEAALAAFARLAQNCPRTHMLMGEQDKIERFWQHYAEGGQALRLACRELLFELRWPVPPHEAVTGLRQATLDDLDLVVPVHAQMAFEESGVNPLEADPEGFRQRCARRIEKGRIWVWIEDGRLIFKTDVVSETPEAIYLEGVWVNPQERGKGYGLRGLSQLSRMLLMRANSVCLLANERDEKACALYRRANYKMRGYYDTIYLQKKGH